MQSENKMNYEIVFTKNHPPEPRVVITKDKMTVFAKGDENSESDFQALQNILKDASYKDWDKVLRFIDRSNRKVEFALFVKRANKACARLLLLVGKIVSACRNRKSA